MEKREFVWGQLGPCRVSIFVWGQTCIPEIRDENDRLFPQYTSESGGDSWLCQTCVVEGQEEREIDGNVNHCFVDEKLSDRKRLSPIHSCVLVWSLGHRGRHLFVSLSGSWPRAEALSVPGSQRWGFLTNRSQSGIPPKNEQHFLHIIK